MNKKKPENPKNMAPNSPQEEKFSGQIAAFVRGRVGKSGTS
jgi:hypothetical protein